ncbi:MAG: DUF4390 domain-containing protein [Pseudomonadota bacterium]
MPACSRRDFLLRAAALAALLAASGARAEGIQLAQAEVTLKGEIFQLSGHFDVQLSGTLENALTRGVQLTFVQEVEAQRERDFWLAEDLIELQRSIRLSYNALLRQYYVTLSGVSSTHDTLVDALKAVGDLRDWAILNVKQTRRKASNRVYIRMYLDLAQLPKPLQVNALASSSRWQLDSGWQERSFKF